MAKPIHKLRDLTIRQAKKGVFSDGGGLYLQVRTSGTKDWYFRYEVEIIEKGKPKRAERKKGLGSYPTIKLQDAREEASRCRKLRKKGVDPIEHDKNEKEEAKLKAGRAKTFKFCADKYIETHKAEWSNEKHQTQWTNTLTKYAYPHIGDLPIQKIDTRLILDVLEPIWSDKTETATRIRQRIETILDWAIAHKYRTGDNPARWKGHLDKILPKPTKIKKVRHHSAMPYSDIPEYFKKLRKNKSASAQALAFIILTATRSSEARKARFEEIDNNVWTIPAIRMKSRREFRAPLSTETLKIIKEAKPTSKDGYIFSGNKSFISDTTIRNLLKETHPNFTIHGFRSSFRDWCAETTNYPREVAEAALAHTLRDKTEAAYQRGDLLEKRHKLMEAWAKYCLSNEQKAKVVPIRKKKKNA